MDNTKTKFVNTPVDNDLLEKIDIMAEKQENTRAGIVRLAIRQLWQEFQVKDSSTKKQNASSKK